MNRVQPVLLVLPARLVYKVCLFMTSQLKMDSKALNKTGLIA